MREQAKFYLGWAAVIAAGLAGFVVLVLAAGGH